MSSQDERKQQLIADGFPPELLEPLARLFKMRQHITVKILPKDAWVVIGLLQFASRNPMLEPPQYDMLRWFADDLTEAIVNQNPIFEKYIAMGWDPSKDVPQQPKGEK